LFTRICKKCGTSFDSEFNNTRFCSSCFEAKKVLRQEKRKTYRRLWRQKHPNYMAAYERGTERICPICQGKFRGRKKKFCSNHTYKQKWLFLQEYPEWKSNLQKELDKEFDNSNGHERDFIIAVPWQRLPVEKFIKKFYETMEEF